jgi:hypothetical protein
MFVLEQICKQQCNVVNEKKEIILEGKEPNKWMDNIPLVH